MPIKAANKKLYPKNWQEISNRIRFGRAKGQCEWPGCTARHGELHPVTGSYVVLTTAHLDHNPRNCADDNLRAWCQMHHNRYDLDHRHGKLAAGQMTLLDVENVLGVE